MKSSLSRILVLYVIFASAVCATAQASPQNSNATPPNSAGNIAASNANSTSPSPTVPQNKAASDSSPSGASVKPDVGAPSSAPTTSVTIGTSGVQLSGFPVWIIWVLLGAIIVGGLAYFLWIKPRFYSGTVKSSKWAVILLSIALVFSIGIWLGSWMAGRGLRQLIDAGSLRVGSVETAQVNSSQPANPSQTSELSRNPTELSPRENVQASLLGTWSVASIIGLSFILLAGFEFILYNYLQTRTHSTWHYERQYYPTRIAADIRELAHTIFVNAGKDTPLERLALRIRSVFEEPYADARYSRELASELRYVLAESESDRLPSAVSYDAKTLLDLLRRYSS